MENIDKYGHCVVCHKSLIVERAVDGKVIKMFTPEHDETRYMLTDGTEMRVCICKSCKSTIDLDNRKVKDQIMEAVINGWDLEVKSLVADDKKPDWTEDKAKNHMDIFGSKKIYIHSESLGKHIIQKARELVLEEMKGDGVRL